MRWQSVVAASLLAVVFLGCGDDDASGPFDAGSDASHMDATTSDTGPVGDSGFDAGMDAGPPDAGFDAGPPDAGFDAGPEGCDPVLGVECDGDWEGRCPTACAATECCSPVGGSFTCVPRGDGGVCGAADIWVDETRIPDSLSVEWNEFPDGDCAIVEGCVAAPGWRRLLKFATWTPNTGAADLFLGRPADMPGLFEYSMCHDHNHFNTYARYELRTTEGVVVAEGHKQAFCLLDYYAYPGTDGRGSRYTCSFQGIQTGWQDVYGEHLDCQWVDVTDVPPGDYLLRIELNYGHILLESDYTNNVSEVMVTVPPDDPTPDVTVACPAGTADGTTRDCGLTRDGPHACTPGAMVTLGCSTRCGVGSCTDDPFLRVCEAADDPGCTIRQSIARNDDSGCGGGRCGGSGDCCPRVSFTCPTSGSYVAFWGAYNVSDTATCTLATE